ncbi:MAG: radical SAM protein [Candidatus Omnitrophica bacterium]|nr:radical SAM protein [Candidatus Omnitrophota bacterium]
MIPTNNDMRFEVSTRCNYRCVICPHPTKLTRNKEIMPTDLFEQLIHKIMAETAQYDTLTFPGMGEPLLDPDLDSKISYAKKKYPGLRVLILTNGSLLTPERFKRFEDIGVESVRVSFYGADAESYCRVHGVASPNIFNQVRSNVEEICRRKKTTALLLTYNIVEGVNNSVVQEWKDHWKDKVDLLEIWRPHNWVDYKEYRPVQSKKLATCGRPFKGPLQIQVDGTVNMCCFDYDGKLLLGDLKKQSLAEIFSSPEFNKLALCHQNGNYTGSGLICENCDQRNADKSDVMVFNSKFAVEDRVNQLSTTYFKMTS